MAELNTLLLFCLFVPALSVSTWKELIVKWDPLGIVSRSLGSSWFTLPTTESNAISRGYVEAESDSDYWKIWCLPNDPRICVLLDQQGNLAGLDIGLPSADFEGTPYDLSLHPMYSNVTRFEQKTSKTRIFLVEQDVLKSGGRSDMNGELGTGLWIVNGDSLDEIPITEDEIKSKTKFTEQSCIPSMGKHYYYNMTKDLDCQNFEPYFLITDHDTGDLHGVGFQAFGSASREQRHWFESVPAIAIRPTVPTSPDCLVDWASKYGVISLHVYFRSNPWTIGCGGFLGTGLFG